VHPSWDKVDDLTQMASPSHINKGEIDYEDSWETDDDDSTVMSIKSKSPQPVNNQTLHGIKEDSDDGFGDFQEAESTDVSIPSQSNLASSSSTKSASSSTSTRKGFFSMGSKKKNNNKSVNNNNNNSNDNYSNATEAFR
jgi:hypothetical protein